MRFRREKLQTAAANFVVTVDRGADHDRYFRESAQYNELMAEFYGQPKPTPRQSIDDAVIPIKPRFFSYLAIGSDLRLSEFDADPANSSSKLLFTECHVEGKLERFHPQEKHLYLNDSQRYPPLLATLGMELPPLYVKLPVNFHELIDESVASGDLMGITELTSDKYPSALIAVTIVKLHQNAREGKPLHDRVVIRVAPDKGFAPVSMSHDWCYRRGNIIEEFESPREAHVEWREYSEYEHDLWLSSSIQITHSDTNVFPNHGRFEPLMSEGKPVLVNGEKVVDYKNTTVRKYETTLTRVVATEIKVNPAVEGPICNQVFPAGTSVLNRSTGETYYVIQDGPANSANMGRGEMSPTGTRPTHQRMAIPFLLANVGLLACFVAWQFRKSKK